MAEAFAWLGSMMEWLGKFIPRLVIIPTTDAAVKFVRGKQVKPLGPGIDVYFPLLTKFVQQPVVAQTFDLRPQKLTTADDKTVIVGALISYELVDIEKALAETYHVDSTIRDSALRAVTRVVLGLTWGDLREMARKGTLDTRLKNEAQKALDPYGVRVIQMSLTDLAVTKVYSLVNSNNSIE